jgi:hypothetical protein
MSKFVIADLTDAKSVLQELRGIIPDCPSVPIQPILLESQREPGMWDYFEKFQSVLPAVHYVNQSELLNDLDSRVVEPAEAKAQELSAVTKWGPATPRGVARYTRGMIFGCY